MNLTDKELNALVGRLWIALRAEADDEEGMRAVAREAARWAAEKEWEGEVMWQYRSSIGAWLGTDANYAAVLESYGSPVRAIRVIATTTKEPTNE